MLPFDDEVTAAPTPTRRSAIRVLWIVLAVGILVVGPLVAIGNVVLVVGSGFFPEPDTDPDPELVLSFAGFGSTTGLEVTDLRYEGWLDEAVYFTLRGPTADVDRALAAAGFTESFEPGLHVQASTSIDMTAIQDVSSGEDVWVDADGSRIYRKIVRGTAAGEPSVAVAHVMAFTT